MTDNQSKQTIWIASAVVAAAALLLLVPQWLGSRPSPEPKLPGQAASSAEGVSVRPANYERRTSEVSDDSTAKKDEAVAERMTATFGGGCFWCTEAVFRELKGVHGVVSGYSGGRIPNPTYDEVCSGTTGHAEVIQIEYDPSQVRYEELLEVFFATHDPTSLNRQGNDVGTQYRSVIFAHNDEQKAAAERVIKDLTKEEVYDRKIVTEVTEMKKFYPAENYHQDYYSNNADKNPYCAMVVRPKVEKFRKVFAERLKETEEVGAGGQGSGAGD